MCGIFGYIGEIEEKMVRHCTNLLRHRGPDAWGVTTMNGASFGHRRLAILDLTDTGKQPMSYADGRYWIIYNGEVYNFQEIKSELESKGHRFNSTSDTEVILAAFIEWGEGCIEKFNGMWAFGIWDNSEKSLFLCRDRFGKKPLFFAELSNGFAFASEMKALLPLLSEVKPNLKLVTSLERIFEYEVTEECLIEGIKRFPSGHFAWFKKGKLSFNRYWCTLDNLVDVPESYDAQVEQFRELFLDSCRLRMISDVPIGTALSGGLDSSSTISAIANIARNNLGERQCPDWQHAFVASFPGTPLDETEYANMVTDHLGIDATIIEIDPSSAVSQLEQYFYLFEDLYITSPIPFMLTYGTMADHGIKVTIDGHGADECFAGYSFDYITALSDAKMDYGQVKNVLDTIYEAYPKNSDQFKLPSKLRYWLTWKIKDSIKKIRGRQSFCSKDSGHPAFKDLDNLNRQLYFSAHDTVLPTLLRNYDRYSMANGVEIRMPFMDHRIVSFAFSIPWSSKIRKGFSKSIIRDAVAPFIPHGVAYRKSKIGFNSPIIDWMRGPMKNFFLDTIDSQNFKTSRLVDSNEVASMVRKVVEAPKVLFTDGEKAWSMLVPYFWEQAVLKRDYGMK